MAEKSDEGNVDEITACPDCKGTHLKRDYDHAEIVCADCGLVLEDNIVDTGPEWRAFDMQQENALARAGPPMSTTLPDKGLSTEISPTNRDYYGRSISNKNQSMLFRMRKWQRRARASKSAERNMAVAMREMQAVATNLKLPRRIQETAAFIYRRAKSPIILRMTTIDFKGLIFDRVVIIRVIIINLSAIRPNSSISFSIGFTPRFPVTNWYAQSRLGNRIKINKTGLLRLKFLVENIH